MRLRHVQQADFRKSEITNLDLVRTVNPDIVNRLRPNDVVLFVSGSGKQLLFVHGFYQFSHGGVARSVLPSHKLRLQSGAWDPEMLATYAADAGVTIENIDAFRRHYRNAVAEILTRRP